MGAEQAGDMTARLRKPLRRLLLAGLTLALVASPVTSNTPAPSSSESDRQGLASTNFPEVRIRKLHLVRPDLLPYPLVHEVFC
jgi:hypothetical protein